MIQIIKKDCKLNSIIDIFDMYGKIVLNNEHTCTDCMLRTLGCTGFVHCFADFRRDKNCIKALRIK